MPISELAGEPVHVGPQSDEDIIIAIGSNPEDHAALQGLADALHWRVWSVTTCWDALEQLASDHVAAIFCEAILEDGSWKDVLKLVGTSAGAPPVVVTSRFADAFLWSEVLNMGGYDVLLKPFNARDVTHVLRTISLRAAASTQMQVAGAA